MNLTRFTSTLWEMDTFNVFSDFGDDQSDLFWIDTITDSGSVAIGDEANGVATLTPSDGSVVDNDEVYFATANEVFLFATNRELCFRARLQFAETAAGVYNVAFGAANAVAADLLINDGGGLRASGSIVAIYKVDGESVWRVTARNSSTVTINQTTKAAVAATWYDLVIEVKDWDGVSMEVSYKVDGERLKDANTNSVIVHRIPIASATEMQMFVGAKLGASTNNDATKIDFAYGAQTR
jgi:hypothetical protein